MKYNINNNVTTRDGLVLSHSTRQREPSLLSSLSHSTRQREPSPLSSQCDNRGRSGFVTFQIVPEQPGTVPIVFRIDYIYNKLMGKNNLHTTEAGAKRIRRNLNLPDDEDAVLWCREAIEQADIIIRQGKNQYAYSKGAVVTINTKSNTIITAQPIKAKIRAMRESDYPCLPEFCYQAIFVPEDVEPPPRSIVNKPELLIYIEGYGSVRGDLGVVAELNGQVVGAAWTRIVPAFGHVDSETPELAISILPEFRGFGIGAKLMKKLFVALRENGYAQTSLSVQKENPAVRFYQRLGYRVADDKSDHAGRGDFIMIKDLG